MKKKLFSIILVLFVFSVFIIRVNAANPLFDLPFDTPAKAPAEIPNANAQVRATVTKPFNMSAIKFAKVGGGTIDGTTELKKIVIGTLKNGAIVDNSSSQKALNQLFDNWFTAYCLDEMKKYPEAGLFNSVQYSPAVDIGNGYTYDASSDEELLKMAFAYAAVANDSRFESIFTNLVKEFGEDLSLITILGTDGVYMATIPDGDVTLDFWPYFMRLENADPAPDKVDVGVSWIAFAEMSDNPKVVYFVSNEATYDVIHDNYPDAKIYYLLGEAYSSEYVPLDLTLADLAFQKYYVDDSTTKAVKNYDHALWIVENSYPTLSLTKSLEAAGVDEDALNTEIKALYGIGDDDVPEYKEMSVYGIVQYAIWKVTETSHHGNNLGTTLAVPTTGECTGNLCELNKLYTYLLQDRDYTGYSDPKTYSNKITIKTLFEEGKELYKTTDDAYIYGPYKATYNALVDSSSKITYKFTNTDKTGLTIVDSNLKEVQALDKDQQFFISVSKKANVGSISVDFTLEGITTFEPQTNRGRIYYPVGAIGQNTLSGGKTGTATITGNLKQVVNAKTGVQNIALLLMITLVAFSLGYGVLSYKQKQISLNQ